MNKLFLVCIAVVLFVGCTSLNDQERREYRYLEAHGVDVDHGIGGYEKPNSVVGAGCLNLLPGIGNFYLACGQGGDSPQAVYGIVNLLTWPFSIIWGVPQAAIDANTLNKREMIYYYHYYHYEKEGIKALSEHGLQFE